MSDASNFKQMKSHFQELPKLYRRLIVWSWIGLGAFAIFLPLFLWMASINLFGLFGEIPDLKLLENPKSSIASELYTADGKVLGKYFRKNRTKVEFDDISLHVIRALIATEDERFEHHSGVDFEATLRVVKGVLTLNLQGGGSTLTQQLAKNLFDLRGEGHTGPLEKIPGVRSLVIKAKEWITAKRLERAYTKKEIITMYLNTVSYVYDSHGIYAASQTFFGKKPKDLDIQEAAVLVGMLKNPALYNPKKYNERVQKRRNVVMHQMTKQDGFLTEKEYDSLKVLPLELDFNPPNYNTGLAPYFRGEIKREIQRICSDAGYDLYADGLKVYTTIDSRLQKYAEQATEQHMKSLQKDFKKSWGKREPWGTGKSKQRYAMREIRRTELYRQLKKRYNGDKDSINLALNEKRPSQIFTYKGIVDTNISPLDELLHHKWFLQAGVLSVDPHTGQIKAWVGGINKEYFAYDHVRQSARQPGSTFKPVLYSAAIQRGYSPCYTITDGPVSLKMPDGKTWVPRGKPTGKAIDLKTALAQSLNPIAALLIRDIGPDEVVRQAVNLGIPEDRLDAVPSLALGTSPVSLYEMIRPYCTFVNNGVYNELSYISKIVDKHGKTIYESTPSTRQAMSAEEAFKMVTMLRGSTQIAGGTARSLDTQYKLLDGVNQLGGKTGTTQSSTDGWFMGISKDLVTGVWVGGDDNIVRFPKGYGYLGQGSKMALPIFGLYMQKAYKDRKTGIRKAPFPIPETLTEAQIRQEFLCESVSDSTGGGDVLREVEYD